MKMHVCDICKHNKADAKIKYKYRAIKAWYSFFGCGWDEIELCQDCLDKIIEADKAENCPPKCGSAEERQRRMTIDEAIKRYVDNVEYERTQNLQGCLEFKQLVKWLKELKTYRKIYHKEHMDDCLRAGSEG